MQSSSKANLDQALVDLRSRLGHLLAWGIDPEAPSFKALKEQLKLVNGLIARVECTNPIFTDAKEARDAAIPGG